MSNSDHTTVRAIAPRLTQDDETPEGDPIEIQRLLAWYFRGDDTARHGHGEHDIRDAA
jgi:hypothetical protein